MHKFLHQLNIALVFLSLSNWAQAQEDGCIDTTGTLGFISSIALVGDVVETVEEYLLSSGYLKDGNRYYFPDRAGFVSLESNGNANLNINLLGSEPDDLDEIMRTLTNSLLQEFDKNTLSRRGVRIIHAKGFHCVQAI